MCRIVEKLCSSGALKGCLESSTETPFFLLPSLMIFPSHSLYCCSPNFSSEVFFLFPWQFLLWNVIKFEYFYSILYVSNSHIRVSIPDLCPMHLFHICGCQTDRTTCFHTTTLQNLFSPISLILQWKVTLSSQELDSHFSVLAFNLSHLDFLSLSSNFLTFFPTIPN